MKIVTREVVQWLQEATMEVESLTWRAIAADAGGAMPSSCPEIFQQEHDLAGPLTGEEVIATMQSLFDRAKELCHV